MPNTLRAVMIVLGGGILVGIAARAVSNQQPSGPTLAIADPPTTTCAQQVWPNVDRRCLSWTLAPPPGPLQTPEGNEQPGRRKSSARVQPDMLDQLSVARPLPPDLQAPAARPHARETGRASARAQMRRQRLAERRRDDRMRAARFAFGSFDHSPVSSYAAEPRRRSRIRPTNPQDAYYYWQRPSWQRPFSSIEPYRSRTR